MQVEAPEIFVAAGDGASFLERFDYVLDELPSKGEIFDEKDREYIRGHEEAFLKEPMNLIAACCAASCEGAKEIHAHFRNVAYWLTASFPSSACAAHTPTPGATRQNTEHTIDTKSAHRRIDRCECE